MRAYLHHLALNLGVAISALGWGLLPPGARHAPEDLAELSRGSMWSWFQWGLGVGEKP